MKRCEPSKPADAGGRYHSLLLTLIAMAVILVPLTVAVFLAPLTASEPGLPFTENFADTDLRDDARTNANWSTEEQALVLGWRQKRFGAFGPGVSGVDITADAHETQSVALGDVDGDGDLDLVAGNANGDRNRLYLNNGTADPWNGVSGVDITAEAYDTRSVALGDVDRDGDLDLVAGNDTGERNRLYLNNGTTDPWNGVSGVDITIDFYTTLSVVLGDVDGDGDLDLVAGNYYSQANRLYLNNGTADPWNGVSGVDITADAHDTLSVVMGDVDGDGDLDLVAGNTDGERNRLYLNNGTSDPWNGVSGSDITTDAHAAQSVELGDVDGDGDLDLVVGNLFGQRNRLYLNNGTADPWNGVSGVNITTDGYDTRAVVLGDVDGDGDLDLLSGNEDQANRLYLNNGTADPWNGVSGVNITADAHATSRAVVLGDVDGDGDLDLVAGNWTGQTNRLYLNNGTTNPWNGVSGADITADANSTYSVALGDVDGDGDIDLVKGNSLSQRNRLYLNNGTADPWNGISGLDITTDADDTFAVALGDVDADGDLDLVAGNANGANRLYLNNGTTDPWSGVAGINITADNHSTYSVALGDVDADGDPDLVAGRRLYLNDGDGDPWDTLATGVLIAPGAPTAFSVALGDVDRDGDLDLVAGTSGTNRLYLNDGEGSPWDTLPAGTTITADSDDTRSVVLGDVDRDGDLDLVAGNFIGELNRLYLNDGDGSPWDALSAGEDIGIETEGTLEMVLGDVDGDGDLDLMAGNLGSNYIYLNNGTSSPWENVSGVEITSDTHNTVSLALGDVDGDGSLDVAAGNDGFPSRLYVNSGTPDPWSGVAGSGITADADKSLKVALGDVDGDGDLDLVAGNAFQTNRLYVNNGTSDPWKGVAGSDITTDADLTEGIALGDVDGDGDLDLVAGVYGGTNRLYMNNGTSDPWNGVAGVDITAGMNNTYPVALGDVDGDGDLDLVEGNGNAQANRLYLNNGTSDPWNGVTGSYITTDQHFTISVALGDVDGDGDLDLVAGNWTGQTNRLYLNNGTSDPWNGVAGSDITTDAFDTWSVALGDVDGDGDLDLVAGNYSAQTNRLYLNNGTSDPWNAVTGSDITADADDTRSVVLGDVDGDGDLDLVAPNTNLPNRLYLNNGTADPWNGIAGSDITADADDTWSVALGDVDGDGALDLVAGNNAQINRLYRPVLYHTGQGRATSLRVDTETSPITNAALFPTHSLPPNTGIDYWLSNNGGQRWFPVQPGMSLIFPTSGNDLRWRAELWSLSPARTPRVDEIQIVTDCTDADADRYCLSHDCDDQNATCTNNCSDVDGDGYCVNHECDDANLDVYPGAPQLCDGVNNDCDDPNWPIPPIDEITDFDLDSFPACADCDDIDYRTWAVPGEVRDLIFLADHQTLTWTEPLEPGTATPAYITVRNSAADDFMNGVTCVEGFDASDVLAVDSDVPPVGTAYYYVVAAVHACGWGSAGKDSEGTEREVNTCPCPPLPESCDGADNNCDGTVDGEDSSGCLLFYEDLDDDYYAGDSRCLCRPTTEILPHEFYLGDDCYDLNPDAHPSQGRSYGVHRGDGSFDYDCDGSATRYYTNQGHCFGVALCFHEAGWDSGTIPDCGQSASFIHEEPFISCSFSFGLCDKELVSRTQACR